MFKANSFRGRRTMVNSTGAMSAHAAGEITSLYLPPGQYFDEMREPGGNIRPAWSRLVQSLNTDGAPGLIRRSELTGHLLRENGVTYNVYGAAKDLERPWELDPIPLMLPIAEWQPCRRCDSATRSTFESHLARCLRSPGTVAFRNPAAKRIVRTSRISVAVCRL